MSNFTKLKHLQEGSPFRFRLAEYYKDLYLVKSGDSRCVISGKKQTNEGGWQDFIDDCAPDAEIEIDGTRKTIQIKKDELGIAKLSSFREAKTRGRKSKNDNFLPVGEEFTVKELAEKLGFEIHTINNAIAKFKRENKTKIKVVGYKKGDGKGKPSSIFKIEE